MSETVSLPALGESVTEGTVTRWLKQVGDQVEVDEPLVEVSTDKVDTEIPSPVAGVLEEILVEEDETVEVGADLARIGGGDGAASGSTEDDAAEAEAEAEEAPAEAEDEPEADEPEAEAEAPAADADSSDDAGSGGATEVTLPALGESVTEGTVTRWLKEVGDEVEVDEPLLEVSTDKVDTEIPSPVAGKLLEVKVGEDETAEVGDVLALIGSGSAGSSAPAAAPAPEEKAPAKEEASAEEKKEEPKETPAEAPKQEKTESAPGPAAPDSGSADETRGDGYVTPLVRRLARQHNVDLSAIKGSGVGGRIRKQDVLDAAQTKEEAAPADAPAAAPAAKAPVSSVDPSKRGTTEKAPRIRQVIARRMRESLDTSTQLTQVHEIDMTRIVALRGRAKNDFAQKHGVKLTYLPFITQAVAEALKQHPKLNASFDEDAGEITYHATEDVAIAVDTDRGLLVPVIADTGSLNLSGVASKIADLAERARTNKISPDELSGGTFSITNIGSVGALFDTPIINQPQVAILGTGAIVKRPMVVSDADGNDSIAIRHMMYLCLTYDHRLVDGADAGRFLQTVKARLEAGEFANELGL
ncbi:2-oxoglutarate dehydrogenase, E2 component, dihydrolipoamide succinyltransferase [Citricoccus sp. NR2]|uniref:2-oxoglutarate dehydrogenase, E2 component, dihydrolipoamide succinyltransferase n=1 Tax=Citricoccus sp. NR2 TaxID=3004095 RepID=UPI0022DDA659|nr:2-oxoglutarate dehydrogenase, E2 component, dihydrolipoamide succinyltransferase [Citricoccus sp. NR2]WBL18140.1 2-oxoglutarate dehydrogenase, E2 component, dihydrolipoamide succinyltransferase [Citricoccus sp. NR2]